MSSEDERPALAEVVQPTDPTPVLFKYVVPYADGEKTEVPVFYGAGADHWLSKDPAGLKNAALAWSAPFPVQKSDEQAVVYQFTWNNPRPEVAITTINLEYGDQGSRYGTPALLAITAATKAE